MNNKQEQEENDNFDRAEQVWTPNGAGRGNYVNEDQQFANLNHLERNGTAAAET